MITKNNAWFFSLNELMIAAILFTLLPVTASLTLQGSLENASARVVAEPILAAAPKARLPFS